MPESLTVGCVQVTATPRIADNIALTEPMIRDAAEQVFECQIRTALRRQWFVLSSG